MEILLAVVAVVVIAALLIFKNSTVKGLEVLDVNKNGRVDADDVKAAVQNVVEAVKAVDVTEVKAVVEKTVDAVKKNYRRRAPNKKPVK